MEGGFSKAFTLIEVLLVTILVSFIIGFSGYWYSKTQQGSFLVEETASYLINILNVARQKAVVSEENDNWGVWLINNQKNPDTLYLFKGTTSTIKDSFNLPGEIGFVDPPINSSKIIIFQKLTGETTSTTIKINFANSSLIKTIVVPTSGAIYLSE